MNIKKVLVSTLGTAAVLGAGLFASTTSANADVRVTVKSGDTVAKIANQYNSSVSAIETANNLKNVNLIYVGESLSVPNSTTTASTTTAATTTTQVKIRRQLSRQPQLTTAPTQQQTIVGLQVTQRPLRERQATRHQRRQRLAHHLLLRPGLLIRNLVVLTPRLTGITTGSIN